MGGDGVMAKFSEVLTIVNGRNQKQVVCDDGKYPIYGSGGIMGYANDYICKAETVVIGRKGSINKPIFVETPFWNVDTAFGLCANSEKLNPKYLYYFCEKFDFEKLNTTVTIPSLTKSNLLNVEIPLPNLEKQKQIVELLDKVTSLIFLRKQQLSKLDELVKARFVEMFGDISNSRKVPMQDVCKIITDGTHQPPKFVLSGIPFLFVSNIVTNEIHYDAEKFISEETYNELIKRTPIEVGDVLLSTVGSYGHPAVVKENKPFCFQRHIAYLKPNNSVVNSEYLRCAILSTDLQRQIDESVKGIAQKTLNLSEIRKLRLPLPSLSLQNQFAAFVERIDRQKQTVQQSLEKLELVKKALMQEYFG